MMLIHLLVSIHVLDWNLQLIIQPLKFHKKITFFMLAITSGLPFSSLYAPTERLIFLGFVSLLNYSATPKTGSAGPSFISFHALIKYLGAMDYE